MMGQDTLHPVYVCGPRSTHVHKAEKEPERWCFGERKRRTGTWLLMVDDDPMSYWEPVWIYKCDGCGRDRRYFPGCDPL